MFKNIYRCFFIFFTTVLSLVLCVHVSRIMGKFYIDLARVFRTNIIARGLFIIVIVAILYGFIILVNKLNTKQLMILTIVLSVVTAIIKYVWFVNFPLFIYFDMELVVDIAEFNKLYESFAYRDYLFHSPINIFVVLYLMLLNHFDFLDIWNLVDMGRFMNGIWMLGTQAIIYLIVNELKDRKTAIFSLIVSTMFVPFTAFIVYVYNDIPSTFLYILSTYLYIMFFKTEKMGFAIIACFSLMIAMAFRSVGYIMGFTIFLYVFTILKKYDLKHVIVVVLTIIAVLLPNFILNESIRIAFHNDSSIMNNYGVPIYHFLGSGISKNDKDTPGFYDDSYFSIYRYTDDNKELANDMMKNKYLNQMASYDLAEWADIIYRKFVYQWGDGNFEVDYLNSIGHEGEEMYPTYSSETKLRKFMSAGFIGEYFDNYNNSFWHLIIIILAIHSIFIKNKKEEYLFILPILGFWVFYTIWEVSSHYSFVVLPYVIVLFSLYFEDVVSLITTNLKKLLNKSK